jgi:hypothetical protein
MAKTRSRAARTAKSASKKTTRRSGARKRSAPATAATSRRSTSGTALAQARSDTAVGPEITGPETYARSEMVGPQFFVDPGKNKFWGVEFATDPRLFRSSQRMSDATGYYGSWEAGGPLFSSQGSATFVLPLAAWLELRTGEQIFYRVVTSATATGWESTEVSTALNGQFPSVRLAGQFGRLPEVFHRPEEELWRRDPTT